MNSSVTVLPAKRQAPTGFSPEGCKKLKSSSDRPPYSACNRTEPNTPENSSAVVDYSNPFAISDVLDRLDSGRFGSVTKDIEALVAQKMQMLGPYFAQYPALVNQLLNVVANKDEKAPKSEIEEVTGLTHDNVIDVEGEHIKKDAPAAPLSVVIIDSDDEDDRDKKSDGPFHEIVLPMQVRPSPALKMIKIVKYPAKEVGPVEEEEEATRTKKGKMSPLPFYYSRRNKSKGKMRIREGEEMIVTNLPDGKVSGEAVQREYHASIPYHGKGDEAKIENGKSLNGKGKSPRDKGVYVGVQEEDDVGTKDDGLSDIWREMSMAIECSKDVSVNPVHEEEEEKEEDCDHSFVLKDDLGYVCRVCGVIDKKIENIFEFQYKVKKSTRTYMHDSRNAKGKTDASGIKFAEDDLLVTEIPAHPRHMKQMKPHQVEGFNFLIRNLAGDNPGGCILAHAPGSGKTFMIISFMQSFLGKYPDARPLVVLPKGILSTWKKEFQIWQVEDIPLLDFYSVKADNRFQQLEVLKRWVQQKSILFLGYKQFSSIVCENGTNRASVDCQEILLKAPSILILDEGHNPRNENTDMVQSLAKVKTPRKVVLSGTLYQNHVKEVFNILNLVRPKFLKMETSRPIVKRIHSRVHIPGVRSFFDLVENTLQKDPDFKRKVAVIQDLREMTSKVLHYYKGDFLDELPGLVDFTVVLKLTPRQKQEAERLKRQQSRKFKICSVGSAIYLHPKLKPVAEKCGENSISDSIMDDMIDKLDIRDGVKSKFFRNILNLCESAGERLLVFSQYLLPLKYLERLVVRWKGWSLGKEIFVISGESSSEQREWSMERFNTSPDAKIFFGSIKACGEGISLVGASRIIILDVHLNPSVTRQAIGRAFRPGQTKKVYVYRLVAADSPEEEDHSTCYKKELISKMWFEWNEYCGDRAFEVETVPVKECGDEFLETPWLAEDVKALYRR